MATEEDNRHYDVVAIDLPAPEGWTKKFTPKKGGTPQRNDIVFVSPTGEEIKTRKQLDQYLKSHPGGPAASEFEWSTGDTPRRSARLSEKTKAVVAPTSQSPKKKQKRSGKKQPQEKNDAGVAEEEATGEKDAITEETLESSTVDAKETTDKDVIVPEKPNNEDVEMKTDTEEPNKATIVEPDAKIEESKADEPKTESSEPSAKADEPKEESSEPSVKADEPTKEPLEPEAKSEEAKEASNGGEEAPEGKVDSAVTEGLEEKAVEKEAEAASLQGPTTGAPVVVKRYSYKEIKRATDRFRRVVDSSCGEASYKAKFDDGRVGIVREVKLLDEEGDDSFVKEVWVLGRLHHRHIVALYGFSTGPKRFLVFENMERGSLKEHLSDPLKTPLNWRTRLKIAVGIAAAVEYLHFFCDPPVYRVSISSSTIMLDENFIPKISDISLSNTAENHAAPNPTSSRCPKECRDEGCRNIIFQLGVVILELITGQSSNKGGVDLVQWVREPRFLRSIHKMIDPDLGNSYDPRELNGLLNVARLCLRSVDETRIYTPQILWYLQKKMGITRK